MDNDNVTGQDDTSPAIPGTTPTDEGTVEEGAAAGPTPVTGATDTAVEEAPTTVGEAPSTTEGDVTEASDTATEPTE